MFPLWAYGLSLGISVAFIVGLLYFVWKISPSPSKKKEAEREIEEEEEELDDGGEEVDLDGQRQVMGLKLKVASPPLSPSLFLSPPFASLRE
jgi:hypothetical protein